MVLKLEELATLIEPLISKEDEKRAQNALFYSEQLGISTDTAYDLEPKLNVEVFGRETLSYAPSKLFFEAFKQSLADKPAMILRGTTAYTPGTALGIDPMLDKASLFLESLKDPEVTQRVQTATQGKLWPVGKERQWWQLEAKYVPEVINAWAANIGDQIPIMLTTYAGRIAGSVLGKGIGAIAGGAATITTGGPDPSDVATAPAAMAITQEVVKHLGGAAPLVAMEAGAFLDDASDIGIDADIAEKYARLYGVGSGAIEYAQWLWVLGRYSKITKPAQEKILKQVLEHIGGSVFEGLEEISQNSLENFLLQRAVGEMKKRNPDFKGEAPKITEGWKRSGAIGFGVSMATGLPGTGMSIAKGQVSRMMQVKPETKKFLGEPSVQEMRQAETKPVEVEKPAEEVPSAEVKPAEAKPEEIEKPAEEIAAKPPSGKQLEIEEFETPEEAKIAEEKLELESGELVRPNLYIGNVTEGMKRRIEENVGFPAEDIKGFTEKGFPTKRTEIPITRGEAEKALETLENGLLDDLNNNRINTENDLALANAMWGNIKELRNVLGLEKVQAPFKVIRAQKHKIKVIKNTRSRIWEAVKPTDESKMTVGEVLSAVLKRSARYAKMGYAAGRRELRAQLRAKALAKKRMNKALKTIQQKIPMTVDFFYREAIEALRNDLDLKHRTNRTEATIKSRKEFLQRATEEQKKLIPAKQIQRLGQKSLNDLTIGELEEIAESIQQLITQGKTKRRLTLKPELEQRKKDVQELKDNLEKVKAPRTKPGPQVSSVTEKNLKDKIFDIVKPLTWRPSRLFDWLDGRKNYKGAWHRIFYDNAKGAKANEEKMVNARKESLSAKMKELGISLWDLAKPREVYSPSIEENVKYTTQEMIGIYMASKNERSRLALNFGMNITEEDIKNVEAAMTQEEKSLGDFLLEDYEKHYSQLRRSVIEQENRDMGKEENYSPIRRIGVNYTTLSAEFIDDILNRNTIRRHTPSKGMTIQRKDIPTSLQTKIRLDAVSIWEDQIEKQARYIYRGPLVRHMNKIMANRKLRKMLSERFGNEMIEFIAGRQGYISKFANPYIWRQFGDLEKISGKLRRNTAVAYLAFNLVTMGKQLPSLLLYLPDAGPSHLLSSAIEFATNPMDMINRTRSLDPELKNRAIERELEEIKSTHNGNLIKQKITEYGMEGIYLFDTVARTIGWNAVYQRAKSENLSEGEAIRLARNSTLRTQPAAAAEDLPSLYTTNEFLNWFTMFTNQLNQIYNIATYDIPSYLTNQQYGEAALGMFAMSSVALIIWVVTNRKLPEKPEDILEAMGEQTLNAMPLVARPIMSARKGWSSDLPIFESVKGLYAAVDDLEFTRSDSREIAEAIAVITGIPYTIIKRGVQAWEYEQPTALIGARKPTKKKKVKPHF